MVAFFVRVKFVTTSSLNSMSIREVAETTAQLIPIQTTVVDHNYSMMRHAGQRGIHPCYFRYHLTAKHTTAS